MKETQNIEFKQRWRDDFLAELCGFANAQGGKSLHFEQIRGGMMATIQRERFMAISNRTSQNDIAGKFDDSSNSQQNEPLNDSLSTIHLSENQSKVYTFIKLMAHNNDTLNDSLNEPLNTAYISTRLAMPYSTTKRIVKFLEQNNLIRRVGSKKTGHWEVTVK